jgi:hypothetical protein
MHAPAARAVARLDDHRQADAGDEAAQLVRAVHVGRRYGQVAIRTQVLTHRDLVSQPPHRRQRRAAQAECVVDARRGDQEPFTQRHRDVERDGPVQRHGVVDPGVIALVGGVRAAPGPQRCRESGVTRRAYAQLTGAEQQHPGDRPVPDGHGWPATATSRSGGRPQPTDSSW